MTYKIFYIEDLPADSIKDSLERCGFEVIVNDANDFDSALLEMGKDTDAYLMDFRLTANRGKVDAPTFASTLRTFGDNHRDKPIILISNDKNLPAFENDFTSQDLFDFVVDKKSFRQEVVKYSDRIKSYEGRRTISAHSGKHSTGSSKQEDSINGTTCFCNESKRRKNE